MDDRKAPHLKQFFAFRFAVIMLSTAIISVGLTTGGLYLFYLSSLDKNTSISSAQFMNELSGASEELLASVQDMARLVPPVQASTAYPPLPAKGPMTLLGIGDKGWWKDRFGLPREVVESAFNCFSCVQLVTLKDGSCILLGSSSVDSATGETLRLFATLQLGGEWLAEIGSTLGAHLAIIGESGEIVSASFPLKDVFGKSLLGLSPNELVEIDDAPYGLRTYPLKLGKITAGHYAVFSPAAPLRSLSFTLGAMQVAAFLLALVAFFALYIMTFSATAKDLGDLAGWAGDFSDFPSAPKPPAGRFHEVRILSRAFETLLERLSTAATELKSQNAHLEEQVKEKTKDIFASHSLLQDILAELPQAVILIEKDQSVAYCNDSAGILFDAEAGKNLPEALKIAFSGHFDEHHRSEEIKFTISGKEYSSIIKPVGEGGRSLIVVRDETRRLAIERQLLQAQKLESVSRLAGGVAHEFNNALASILPSVEILRTRTEDEKSQGYLNVIENSAQRGADVVKRILAFSRASEEVRTRLNLNEAVEGAVKLLRPAAKSVDVLWSPGENLPMILGDEKRLQQMILNLAINSLDALEGKGRIVIETWTDAERKEAYVALTDNGPGIPQILLENIFDPFFTTKEPGKGTGLGLAITFAVIEQHGGTIRHVRPTAGGTRFEIKFPGLKDERPLSRPAYGSDDEIVIG